MKTEQRNERPHEITPPSKTTDRGSSMEPPEEIIESVLSDLYTAKDALTCLLVNFEGLIDHSIEGTKHMLRLISEDIDSIHDDIVRRKEGRCTVRQAAASALRPPLLWEESHQSRERGQS